MFAKSFYIGKLTVERGVERNEGSIPFARSLEEGGKCD